MRTSTRSASRQDKEGGEGHEQSVPTPISLPSTNRSFTEIPLRRYVELPSVFQILGDVTGLCVLDLACGTGYYAEELRRRGAARVVGVKITRNDDSRHESSVRPEPLGVEYVRADAGALERLGDFDLVIGIRLSFTMPARVNISTGCVRASRETSNRPDASSAINRITISPESRTTTTVLLQRQDFREARRRTAVCIFGHVG